MIEGNPLSTMCNCLKLLHTRLVGGTSESEGEEMEVFETEAGIVEPISEDEAQVNDDGWGWGPALLAWVKNTSGRSTSSEAAAGGVGGQLIQT
jgi:hypothetical protein